MRVGLAAFAFVGMGCAASQAPQRARYVVTRAEHDLDAGPDRTDRDGIRRREDGTVDTAFCERKCGFALSPGERVVGCRQANPTDDLRTTLRLPWDEKLLVCKLR